MSIDELLQQYYERFGEGFPTFQLLRGRTEEESAELIQHCIDEGKDAYELGLVTADLDIDY